MKQNRFREFSVFKQRSISRKLILYIIVFSSVVTLLATSFQVYLEYQRDMDVIERTLSDIENSYLPSVINNVWIMDDESLQEQLKGIVKLPDIKHLQLEAEGAHIIAAGEEQTNDTIKRAFKLIYSDKKGDTDLGVLEVYADLKGVYQRVWDRAMVILATQAMIISLLSAFIIAVFYLLIGRHLQTMSEYTRSLAFDALEKPLVLRRNSKDRHLDELKQLELSINEMRENLTSDILKRESIERQLRESEDKHRTLLDNIPQKIFYKDSQSVYITCNNNYAADLNTTKQAIVGKTDYDFYPRNVAEKYRADDQAVIREKITRELEEFYVKDGNEFIVQTIKTPIFDSEGNNIGLLGIFWDITEKKKYEQELQKAKDELELRVSERTARLQEINNRLEEEVAIHKQTEEKLIFAKQDAERANKAKSEFLSNISHELRTPMHHILNYSRFGLEKNKQVPLEKLIHYFSQIRKTGNRLMILLNDLLDLSKLESGRAEYKVKRHNILKVLEDASAEIRFLAREKEVELIINTEQAELYVHCDAYKVGQVFRNLLSNAIKYSPIGHKVTVSLSQRETVTSEEKTKYLRISVTDQGIGIPEKEYESIFDKFTQSSKTKTGAGGSGLGLAICKEIVEGHKGRIWAINNSSGGATFYFTLPMESKLILPSHSN
ncbi:MAG: ATP-binding protein [Proteobacteria bacterium]|nr:ATP-binding protein [Pseudomonadota bacterium]